MFFLSLLWLLSSIIIGSKSFTSTDRRNPYIRVSKNHVNSHEWVKVKFGNIDDPTLRDGCFLALISPADADVSIIHPEQNQFPDYPSQYSPAMPYIATAPVNNPNNPIIPYIKITQTKRSD